MEPDEFQPRIFSPSDAISSTASSSDFKPSLPDYHTIERSTTSQSSSQSQDSNDPAAQNYYPYYRETPALGHSRPYYPVAQQPQHLEPIPAQYVQPRTYDQQLLGSGDFGVIRGGTFYQDNDPPFRAGDTNDYYSYYLNGHGRPHSANSYFQPQKYNYPTTGDQFANFRDFADINAPGDPAYSQFVVVYANKNSTAPHPNPKNIFEQLELLDKEVTEKPIRPIKPKFSKTKSKLAKTKTEKKYKKKLGPKDTDYEPLLALS